MCLHECHVEGCGRVVGSGSCLSFIFSRFIFFRDRQFAWICFFGFLFMGLFVVREHEAGPAHLAVIRDMFASSVASGAACMRVVKCTCMDEMSSHVRALSVCMYVRMYAHCIFFLSDDSRTTISGRRRHAVVACWDCRVFIAPTRLKSVHLNIRDLPTQHKNCRENSWAS